MEILAVTVPIFLFVAAGYLGRKKNIISAEIRTFLSRLVYYFAMPALVIRSILLFDFRNTFRLDLVAHNLLVTGTICAVSFFAAFILKDPKKRGSFNMSSFRSNQGYVGLPVIRGFYGEQAMSKTAVINGFETPFAILLSALTLEIYRKRSGSGKKTLIGIVGSFIGNPLVMAAYGSLILSYFDIPVLDILILDRFLETAAYMALPLALISIGASIRIGGITKNMAPLAAALAIKLLLMPFIAYIFAVHLFGFSGEDLGISIILTAMPTAVSSYIMAAEMDADEELIATAIGLSAFVSVITVSVIKYIIG